MTIIFTSFLSIHKRRRLWSLSSVAVTAAQYCVSVIIFYSWLFFSQLQDRSVIWKLFYSITESAVRPWLPRSSCRRWRARLRVAQMLGMNLHHMQRGIKDYQIRNICPVRQLELCFFCRHQVVSAKSKWLIWIQLSCQTWIVSFFSGKFLNSELWVSWTASLFIIGIQSKL